jgi:hypothetical protein
MSISAIDVCSTRFTGEERDTVFGSEDGQHITLPLLVSISQPALTATKGVLGRKRWRKVLFDSINFVFPTRSVGTLNMS